MNMTTITLSITEDPGRALRVLRALSGCTQRAVAERAGIANETLSRLERGHRRPSRVTRERLLAALTEDRTP